MTKLARLTTIALMALPATALAHPGHIAEHEGHSHFIAYGAAGLAVAIALGALWFVYRRRVRRQR